MQINIKMAQKAFLLRGWHRLASLQSSIWTAWCSAAIVLRYYLSLSPLQPTPTTPTNPPNHLFLLVLSFSHNLLSLLVWHPRGSLLVPPTVQMLLVDVYFFNLRVWPSVASRQSASFFHKAWTHSIKTGFSVILFLSDKQLNTWLKNKSVGCGAPQTNVFEAVKTPHKLEKVQLKIEKVKKKKKLELALKQIRVMKAGEMLTDGEQNMKAG